MTTPEACDLIIELTRELSLTRGEREAFRALAHAAIDALHQTAIERDQVRTGYSRLLEDFRVGRAKVAA